MWTIIVITVSSFILSVIIVLIDAKFNQTDTYIEEITAMLPGYNCGACGYGSCKGMAEAILNDPTSYSKCRPLKEEDKQVLITYLDKKKR